MPLQSLSPGFYRSFADFQKQQIAQQSLQRGVGGASQQQQGLTPFQQESLTLQKARFMHGQQQDVQQQQRFASEAQALEAYRGQQLGISGRRVGAQERSVQTGEQRLQFDQAQAAATAETSNRQTLIGMASRSKNKKVKSSYSNFARGDIDFQEFSKRVSDEWDKADETEKQKLQAEYALMLQNIQFGQAALEGISTPESDSLRMQRFLQGQ